MSQAITLVVVLSAVVLVVIVAPLVWAIRTATPSDGASRRPGETAPATERSRSWQPARLALRRS